MYDQEERREVEADMREAKRAPQKPAAPTKEVAAAATVTGAPVAVQNERAKLADTLDAGITYAKSIGLDPNVPDLSTLSNEEISETVAALRTQCRVYLAEQKKKAEAQGV